MMAESFRLSFGFMGEGGRPGKVRKNTQEISLGDALSMAQNLPMTDAEKASFSEVLRKAPSGSLRHIVSNYRNYLKKP